MSWLASGDSLRQKQIKTFREYYEGEHKVELTDRLKEFLGLNTAADLEFKLNFMPIPIDVMSERMKLDGFDADVEAFAGKDGLLMKWWDLGRMDGKQKDNHLSSFRDGDSFMIVGWNDEEKRPTFDHEMAFDGDQGVRVHYSNEAAGEIEYAVKRWTVDDGTAAGLVLRANIYRPDAIYKYISNSKINEGTWQPFIEGDGGEWPVRWTDRQGRPLGIPVIHFPNNAAGYNFGKSELKDLIPVQDAMNKSLVDELAAADVTGFQMLTLTGGEVDDDFVVAPGRVLSIDATDASWGHIPAGDIKKLSDTVDKFVTRIAQMSRTPLSYFQISGQVARAETQAANDGGLVSKVQDRSVRFGNAYEDMMKVAARLNEVFGNGPAAPALISSSWASFEVIDPLEQGVKKSTIVATLVAAGSSLEGAMRIAGYTEDQISDALALDSVEFLEQ